MTTWDTTQVSRLVKRKRIRFDPTNTEHLTELKYFRTNLKWKSGCPFELEWPYMDVPSMCSDRYLDHVLSKLKLAK
jgi:hypothetical protein